MSQNETKPDDSKGEAFPTAIVRQRNSLSSSFSQSTTLVWLVAAACLVVAIFISVRALTPRGTPITVHFAEGYGLQPEDHVRFRGIIVGEVDSIELDESLQGVSVHIHLVDDAAGLARQGAQFWIERPQISLGSVRGLDTIVGGRYVAVLPGPDGAEVQHEFVGTELPPPNLDATRGGLEVMLVAENRFGLERGAPITYRGLHVGQVASVALSSDAHAIEVRGVVENRYSHLVRTNSQFWNNGGMDFKIGLRGVDVDIDTLASLAAGGIGFATPDPAGPPAAPGERFELAEEEVEGWQEWQPLIQMGEAIRDRLENQDENSFLNRLRARFSGKSDTQAEEDESGES